MQLFLTVTVLAIAVVYAVWRLKQAFSRPKSPCDGCSGCILSEQQKKNKEKFCQKK